MLAILHSLGMFIVDLKAARDTSEPCLAFITNIAESNFRCTQQRLDGKLDIRRLAPHLDRALRLDLCIGDDGRQRVGRLLERFRGRRARARTPTSASCGKCSQRAMLRAGVAERLIAVVCAF
jgi:hypothetical protein